MQNAQNAQTGKSAGARGARTRTRTHACAGTAGRYAVIRWVASRHTHEVGRNASVVPALPCYGCGLGPSHAGFPCFRPTQGEVDDLFRESGFAEFRWDGMTRREHPRACMCAHANPQRGSVACTALGTGLRASRTGRQ